MQAEADSMPSKAISPTALPHKAFIAEAHTYISLKRKNKSFTDKLNLSQGSNSDASLRRAFKEFHKGNKW